MKNSIDYSKFQNLNYEKFRLMALDTTLTCYEKIGFPNSYREGYEKLIWEDIQDKLPNLSQNDKVILDIGTGLSELPYSLINTCRKNQHTLILVDAPEILDQLPNEEFIIKIPGKYPFDSSILFKNYLKKIDIILCYSVFHYIFTEGNIYQFLDKTLSLLGPQGQMLLGDIPNSSKRKRFFSSSDGIKFHQTFTNSNEIPEVNFNCIEHDQIDDAVLLSIISRSRNSGFEAFILPQNDSLPMANRREDILIKRN